MPPSPALRPPPRLERPMQRAAAKSPKKEFPLHTKQTPARALRATTTILTRITFSFKYHVYAQLFTQRVSDLSSRAPRHGYMDFSAGMFSTLPTFTCELPLQTLERAERPQSLPSVPGQTPSSPTHVPRRSLRSRCRAAASTRRSWRCMTRPTPSLATRPG
jgi:hypothetical protein